jgi:hypothetical protein
MANNKPIVTDWEKIFLDSSVLINLLLYHKGSKDPVCLFVYKLISFLSSTKQNDGKSNRKFYVSAVALSEVLDRDSEDIITTVINLINSHNVEFVSFDDEIAKEIAKDLAHHLTTDNLNRFAEEIGWKKHELVLAREWINRDYMISMSGRNRGVDVHLTTDHKTFYPICKKIDAFCAICNPDLFDVGGDSVFLYHTDKVDSFVNNLSKKSKKTKDAEVSQKQ